MRTVKVEFKKNGKQYIFLDNNIELAEEENVIVETEKGLQFGKITSVGESTTDDNHALVIRIEVKKMKNNIKKI